MEKTFHISRIDPIPPLTGLRFIAAFCIVLAHGLPKVMPVPVGQAPSWYVFMTSLWGFGMTLFFVLSGFVIHYNYSSTIKKNPLLGIYNFLVARIARLYPLFLVGLLFDLAHRYGYSMLHSHFKESLLYYLSLTQSWFYVVFNTNELIYQFGHLPSVAWSISTEFFFYLCYPLILLLLLRASTISKKILWMFIFYLLIVWCIILIKHNLTEINAWASLKFGPIADLNHGYQDCFYRWLIYFSPYSRVSEFILGCFSASIYLNLKQKRYSAFEGGLGMVLLIVMIAVSILLIKKLYMSPNINTQTYLQSYSNIFSSFFGLALPVSVIIFCCARYENSLTHLLASPKLLILGDCSYSIYLFHLYIIEAFSRDAAQAVAWPIYLADGARFLLTVTAILGFSLITYNFIEVPAKLYIRNKLARRFKHNQVQEIQLHGA